MTPGKCHKSRGSGVAQNRRASLMVRRFEELRPGVRQAFACQLGVSPTAGTIRPMTPEQFNAYLVSGGLVLGALYTAIHAYEAWPKLWKVAAFALTALALAILAYYYSVKA